MGHVKNRTSGIGVTLMVVALLSCVGNQPARAGAPNPNEHAAGAGKADSKPGGPGLNLAEFQPVYLKLAQMDANGCPDPSYGIVASPDPVTVHRDLAPSKLVWIATPKKHGTTWTIWGGNATYYVGNQPGPTTGQNPFPDPKGMKRTLGPGTNPGDDGPNAYWSEQPQLPDASIQGTKDIHWKYTIRVTGIVGNDKTVCAPVEVDPIVIFPGGP